MSETFMCNGSLFLVGLLAAASFAFVSVEARAQDDMRLEFGTYAQSKDWCKLNRADQKGPDYTEKRAYINLSATEMNWQDTVARITNVSVEGNRINLALDVTSPGKSESKTYQLIRKSQKIFVLAGINFFYCSDYQPNPRLGR
jgi:hypothetical protein